MLDQLPYRKNYICFTQSIYRIHRAAVMEYIMPWIQIDLHIFTFLL